MTETMMNLIYNLKKVPDTEFTTEFGDLVHEVIANDDGFPFTAFFYGANLKMGKGVSYHLIKRVSIHGITKKDARIRLVAYLIDRLQLHNSLEAKPYWDKHGLERKEEV